MKEYKNRLIIATIILAQALLILTVRMWYLQILKGNEFERFSLENRVRIARFPAPRGRILDRVGRELVANRSSFDVYVFPNDVNDIDSVAGGLSHTLGIDVDAIRKKITNSVKENRFKPTLIAKDINRDQLAFLEARKISLPGIIIQINHTREYPHGNIGAHLLGHLGKADKDDLKNYPKLIASNLVGKDGVERSLEKHIRGEDGYNQKVVDAYGREITWHLLEKDLKSKDSTPGSDVFLSINLDLQKAAEESLGERAGAVVVLDVRTGELLALVSHPNYHPEDFIQGMDHGEWERLLKNQNYPLLNRATQGTYAPGSVFKIVTAAAALKEGIVDPDTRFFCPGSYKLGNRDFRCWRRGGHGWVNLHRAIVESCDVYFYHIAEELGINRFAKYIKAFGFGSPTGINLNEREGIAPSREWKLKTHKKPWYIGETVLTGIGQGYINATPLQVSLMTASIANGGVLLKPQIVKKVISPDGDIIIKTVPSANGHIPVGQEESKHIMDALRGVVNDSRGTGRGSRLDSMLVAGKTGTAQVISLDSKSDWLRHKDHAWFTSYAPADDPEIAVTVIVEHGGQGGAVAAPIVRQILNAYQRLREDGQIG